MQEKERASLTGHTSPDSSAPGTVKPRSLDDLPTEILCLITDSLQDAQDIKNLRLTNRTIASQVSGGHFRTHFRKKNITLRIEDLIRFYSVLQPNSLAYLLEDITITGIISRNVPESSHVKTRLLTKAFTALKKNAGGLRSLSFDVIHE